MTNINPLEGFFIVAKSGENDAVSATVYTVVAAYGDNLVAQVSALNGDPKDDQPSEIFTPARMAKAKLFRSRSAAFGGMIKDRKAATLATKTVKIPRRPANVHKQVSLR